MIINFLESYGAALIPESSLMLVDRSLSFGDVVKRSASDTMSGTIIRTWIDCDLRSAFRPVGSTIGDDGSSTLRRIPGEELKLSEEYEEGDFILYQGWLGMVEEVFQDVTLRLKNGSIVVVDDPSQLTSCDTCHIPNLDHVNTRRRRSSDSSQPRFFNPGLLVRTSKGNVRRGNWKLGSFDPFADPCGYIIEAKTKSLGMQWLGYEKKSTGLYETSPPPLTLRLSRANSSLIQKYDRGRMPQSSSSTDIPPGTTNGSNLQYGDFVRFRDLRGAAVKYPGNTYSSDGIEQGKLIEIPAARSAGYDVNVFLVAKTRTKVQVLWQDLVKTTEDGVDLLPYLNCDDHDVWPGEMVSRKLDDNANIRSTAYGIVQAVDSTERVAEVRWFTNVGQTTFLRMEDSGHHTLCPGFSRGKLDPQICRHSFYELQSSHGLSKRRGDFVIIEPLMPHDMRRVMIRRLLGPNDPDSANLFESPDFVDRVERLVELPEYSIEILEACREFSKESLYSRFQQYAERSSSSAIKTFALLIKESVSLKLPPSDSLTASDLTATQLSRQQRREGDVTWVGEIVDLGLDGSVTVRLGAADECQDVKFPMGRLTVIYSDDDTTQSDDDEDDYDDTIDDEAMADYYDNLHDTAFEYEGGNRIEGDGGEEMWSTDDSWSTNDDEDEDDVEESEFQAGTHQSLADTMVGDASAPMAHPLESIVSENNNSPTESNPHPTILPPNAVTLSTEGILKFDILSSDPPADHHYISLDRDLDPKQMRRIHKEHQILSTSLPDGIFTRTWESRLDLLRVLIIGPKHTPYEFAPFICDFLLGATFPNDPPSAYFHSWTDGIGRVNPNLYTDGKICLSLLGTWPSRTLNEAWSSANSTILQILVSIMGLILVKDPYYSKFAPSADQRHELI